MSARGELPRGPYETRESAAADVAEILLAGRTATRPGVMADRCHELLHDVFHAAGVGLGAYDRAIITWMCGWEPEMIAVIAGWVTRARGAGEAVGMVPRDRRLVLDALDDAAEWREREAANDSPQGGMREVDLGQAGAYRALTDRLRTGGAA